MTSPSRIPSPLRSSSRPRTNRGTIADQLNALARSCVKVSNERDRIRFEVRRPESPTPIWACSGVLNSERITPQLLDAFGHFNTTVAELITRSQQMHPLEIKAAIYNQGVLNNPHRLLDLFRDMTIGGQIQKV